MTIFGFTVNLQLKLNLIQDLFKLNRLLDLVGSHVKPSNFESPLQWKTQVTVGFLNLGLWYEYELEMELRFVLKKTQEDKARSWGPTTKVKNSKDWMFECLNSY